MKKELSIYELDDCISESILTEKVIHCDSMYDIRRMSEYIHQVGRPLTNEEARQFIVKK